MSWDRCLMDCAMTSAGAAVMGERIEQPWLNRSDDYVDMRQIGSGAYGTVWVCKNKRTGQEAARKRVRVQLTGEGVPQNVVREISTLRSIERYQHPNIVRLFGVEHGLFNNGTELCIDLIFEKCDFDLYSYMSGLDAPLQDLQVRQIAKNLLCGVDFLHEHNIIHRDLKPQNILVNRTGEIKLADFGLARVYSLYAAFTTTAVTLWYRSPEVLLQCMYGPSVDVWALGCIVAELYNKVALFRGQTEVQQLQLIFQTMGLPSADDWPADAVVNRESFPRFPAQPMERVVQRAPPDAIAFIKSLLRFRPTDRPTCQEALQFNYFRALNLVGAAVVVSSSGAASAAAATSR